MNNIEMDFFENASVKKILCGYGEAAKIWFVKNLSCSHHRLYYYLGGKSVLTIENETFRPKPRDFFFIPKGAVFSYAHNPEYPVSLHWVHFELELNQDRSIQYSKGSMHCIVKEEEILPVFELLFEADKRNGVLDKINEQIAIMSLLYIFFNNTNYDNILMGTKVNQYHKVIEYIDKNYTKEITLNELADVVHLQKSYFIQYFKKHFSKTPVTYINDYRLEKSTLLLANSKDLRIEEIAYSVGFRDGRYYSRLFIKRYGMTPSQFRHNNWYIDNRASILY